MCIRDRKNARKIGGLRGLYLHCCYKLGILPKNKKQNYARLHYHLKDDLMKMEAITQETRLLCRNRIDTVEQLLSYKGSLETEKTDLLQKIMKPCVILFFIFRQDTELVAVVQIQPQMCIRDRNLIIC